MCIETSMKKVWEFLNQFENTRKFAVIVFALVGLSYLFLQTQDVEQLSIIPIDRKIIFNLALILLICLVVVGAIEFLYLATMGSRKNVSQLFSFLFRMTQRSISFIYRYVYIVPISFFLRPIVLDIIQKQKPQKRGGVEYRFVNTAPGRDSDDVYYPNHISTKSVSIQIQPINENRYWRFGVKFSKDDTFTSARFDSKNPLFHLTKDLGKKELEFNLYVNGENTREVLLSNYSNQPIVLSIVSHTDSTRITILDEYNNTLKELNLSRQNFAQLLAWADGIAPFNLLTSITVG